MGAAGGRDRQGVVDQRPMDPVESVEAGPAPPWAIVLAGGEGLRLRPLTRLICGDERPKQYAVLGGTRSLLRRTLDRVALLIPQERTVVVTQRRHARYAAAELAEAPMTRAFAQPGDRGTAAGILVPAHWIHREEPGAIVAVFPSDHFILEERAFMSHVADVAAFVRREPRWLVLLGAPPTGPDTGYGWVEPGEPLGRIGGNLIRRARRFWEKPSEETASACLAGGCLWNTFVFVSRVTTLLAAAERCLPALSARLAGVAAFSGVEDRTWAVERAYASIPTADFSRSVLEPCPPSLAVATLPGVTWCDLGTPERAMSMLSSVEAWAS